MSGAPLVLTIDAGTGSCRAIAFDRAGAPVAMEQREWTHATEPEHPGSQVFDTAANWRLICSCARSALAAVGGPDRIASVSATSMREGMVLWDEGGRELWACPNVDSRAGEQATRLIADGSAERIYRTAGDWVAITAPARFLWLADHRPDLLERCAHVGMLSDWIVGRLAGTHVTDPTAGSSSGMFDLSARGWSNDIIASLALPRGIFPPVLEPGSVVGEVSSSAAADTGLAPGTPVVLGGADTQLGLLGIGRVEPGDVTIVGGTFWQQTAVLAGATVDPDGRLRTLCHVPPDRWMIEGLGFYSGLVLRWFRDAFCADEAASARAAGEDPYAAMERIASEIDPGARPVIGVFSNVMNARRWVHGAPSLLGFDVSRPEVSGRGACIRAILESAAFVSRSHVDLIGAIGGGPPESVVFTGGAAKGSLWPQILADVLGVPVQVPLVTESTSLGASLLARVGAGLDEDLYGLSRTAGRIDRTFEPDGARRAAYDESYGRWQAVNTAILDLCDAGALEPLWRAAGA